jgi:FkbM family methyltransferase
MRIIHPSMTAREVLTHSLPAALLTTRPVRFMRYETVSLAGPRAVTYALTGGAGCVVVRHGTEDAELLALVLRRRPYRLSAAAAEALRGLPGPPRIADLGAHTGVPALTWRDQFPGAQVLSVEPDPMNALMLRRTVGANPGLGDWTVRVAAVGDGAFLRGPGYGRLGSGATEAERAERAPALDAFELLHGADLARLNVQGREWGILADARLAQLATTAIVVECHRRGCPGPDPVTTAVAALTSAGYATAWLRKRPGGSAVVCAWRA